MVLTIRLAKQFGFCYGVERAIDLAYAAAKVFPDQRDSSWARSFTIRR
jgi:4-hydroxy-3-methylbut-2-enyl diphosphate reductase